MKQDKLKTQDILVLALAVVTVLVCLLVLIPNFSQRNDMAAITTPEPTVEPTPAVELTPEPTAEPTPEPTPEPNVNEEYSRAQMEAMSIEAKVWQLFLVTPESLTGVDAVTISGDGMQSALESYPVGGLVYASQNVQDEPQLAEMLAGAQARSALPLFITYDSNAGSAPIAIDGNMRALGFNLGLGNEEDGLIYAASYEESLPLSGLAAVVAPSDWVTLGEDTEDSSAVSMPWFASEEHIAALREAGGWDGLILTPLLSSGYDGYSDGELAVAALNAGCDMICAPNDPISAGQAVIDAINGGELSLERVNEAVQRILYAKFEAGLLTAPATATETLAEPATDSNPAAEPAPVPETETTTEAVTEAQSDDSQGTRG